MLIFYILYIIPYKCVSVIKLTSFACSLQAYNVFHLIFDSFVCFPQATSCSHIFIACMLNIITVIEKIDIIIIIIRPVSPANQHAFTMQISGIKESRILKTNPTYV